MLKKGLVIIFILGLSIGIVGSVSSFPKKNEKYIAEPISEEEKAWVESIMDKLTLREKIAQLFMFPAYSNLQEKHIEATKTLVRDHKIGGLIFFQGTPFKQAQLTNTYQALAKTPLIIGMDAEWGVAMRLDSVISFPRQMTLGAITNNELLYEFGAEMAQQCKILGVHINFTPSVDINSNSNNPVINTRSFGENKEDVASKGIAIMRGLQDNDIIASAKHFPGHGDTDKDSHHELPIISHSRERLDSVEFYPFKQLINNGIAGVMIAHLHISSIDGKNEVPASLSEKVIKDVLKKDLNFDGLVMSDALNMKAVKQTVKDEHIAISALKAGNDILLMPDNIAEGITAVEKAVTQGKLTKELIDEKCRKVLTAKYRVGLNKYEPIDLKNLTKRLNTTQSEVLKLRLIESAITLVTNKENILPLKKLENKKIAYLEIGKNKGTHFYNQLSIYKNVKRVTIDKNYKKEQLAEAKKELKGYNTLIVGYHIADSRPQRNFGADISLLNFVEEVAKDKKVIFNIFGSPYFLTKIDNSFMYESIIVSYDNSEQSQEKTAQAIFGGIPFRGKLPVSAGLNFDQGMSVETQAIRLSYVSPEEIGIATADLKRVDSLINVAINQKAMPGCQVLASYKGQVFYNKAFGKHSYDKAAEKVKISDIYDVASVTKTSATLPIIMKMLDSEKIDLAGKLKDYISFNHKTANENLVLRDILLHQSGLPAWVPFYQQILVAPDGQKVFENKKTENYSINLPGTRRYMHKNTLLDKNYFATKTSSQFAYPVATGIYASNDTRNYIYNYTDTIKLMSKTYRYSDLGFMYLQRIIEAGYENTENKIADSLFYNSLGMSNTSYLPLNKFNKNRIPPTEDDKIFRRQLVHGYVHDPAAAMLGGIAGHAGLFSNSNDLAKLYQMYLNKGEYGDERYLKETTIEQFTKYNNKKFSRRGLGFDKPETDPKKASPVCKEASFESYGHSGFTGALVWVDPERDLIYVFLSNRVNPSAENTKIIRLGTRTEILAQFIRTIDKLKEAEKKKK